MAGLYFMFLAPPPQPKFLDPLLFCSWCPVRLLRLTLLAIEFFLNYTKLAMLYNNQLRIQGGSQGGHAPPLSLLKLVIKKMAAIGGPLYFMFLAPPPSDLAGSDAE